MCVVSRVEQTTLDAVKVMNPGAREGDMKMGEIEGTRSALFHLLRTRSVKATARFNVSKDTDHRLWKWNTVAPNVWGKGTLGLSWEGWLVPS